MYKIPLNNSPNQNFTFTVPVNGNNRDFEANLNYNYQGLYWSFSLIDVNTREELFTNLPLLESKGVVADIAYQLQYGQFGSIYVVAVDETTLCRPIADDIGIKYILVWGDNTEL